MNFKKYQHVSRLGEDNTRGILDGRCYIQPKLDGTNGSLFLDSNGNISAGSRRRILGESQDNMGFFNHISKDERFISYLAKHPTHRLYGEWLKPHSLKTYEDEAWDKFYVFDVCIDDEEGVRYVPYEEYKPLLEEFNIDYVPVLAIMDNPTNEQLTEILNNNNWLIKESEGCGEGVVIKNYNYKNYRGEIVWGKLIHKEYRNHSSNKKASQLDTTPIELKIAQKYATTSLIEKEYHKIINDGEDIQKKELIPRIINTVMHSLITEDMWNIFKEFKSPTVDFKQLQSNVVNNIKEALPDLFIK